MSNNFKAFARKGKNSKNARPVTKGQAARAVALMGLNKGKQAAAPVDAEDKIDGGVDEAEEKS